MSILDKVDDAMQNPKRLLRKSLAGAGIVFGLTAGMGSYHIVPPGTRGVSVTLGSVDDRPRGEGLNFKFPFIQTIHDVSIKQQTVAGKLVAASSDLQQVNVEYNVLYSIPESQVVPLFKGYSGDPYQSLVEPRVQESIKQATAQHSLEDALRKRVQLKEDSVLRTRAAVGKVLNIGDVVINDVEPTKELAHSIEQKMIQEQQALAKKFELDKAKRDAEIAEAGAKGQAAAQVARSEAEATSIRNVGKATAEAIGLKANALRQNPNMVELTFAEKWNGKLPETMVTSSGSSPFTLFKGMPTQAPAKSEGK